jgi:diguanylate cyclase (GGDEF)-like protein
MIDAQKQELSLAEPDLRGEIALARERLGISNALLGATAFILQADGAREIIVRLCDALIQATPHVRLAWFWLGDAMQTEIRPQIAVGPARDWAERLVIHRDWLSARGHMYALPTPRDAGVHGSGLDEIGAAIALPVSLNEGRHRALLAFYADDSNYFERIGIMPFRALARFAEVALERTRLNEKLERLAATDPLTGLLTRRAMCNQVMAEIERCYEHKGEGSSFGLLLFDVDRFKSINDNFGHDGGDVVLKHVAHAAKGLLRDSDAVGRWGGEEFLMLIANAEHDVAVVVAERLRQQVGLLSVETMQGMVGCTVSIGVASFGLDGNSVEELVRAADKRLYEAKQGGRNRVVG